MSKSDGRGGRQTVKERTISGLRGPWEGEIKNAIRRAPEGKSQCVGSVKLKEAVFLWRGKQICRVDKVGDIGDIRDVSSVSSAVVCCHIIVSSVTVSSSCHTHIHSEFGVTPQPFPSQRALVLGDAELFLHKIRT